MEKYHAESLPAIRAREPSLKRYGDDMALAGLAAASGIERQGLTLAGVPGFFKLGGYWCFKMESGMLIPTRNAKGQIVAMQARKDNGDLRYKTISSKGLPYGVTEGISRAHFPLENASISPDIEVMLTEGPLKADIAAHLLNGESALIALQGVNNTNEIPSIIDILKDAGVTTIYNAFDMDKTTNIYVAKAGRTLRKKFAKEGINMPVRCWDERYAEVKEKELLNLCLRHGIPVREHDNIFTRITLMAQSLTSNGIQHSVVTIDGAEKKDCWSEKTKGLDDYLLSLKED